MIKYKTVMFDNLKTLPIMKTDGLNSLQTKLNS